VVNELNGMESNFLNYSEADFSEPEGGNEYEYEREEDIQLYEPQYQGEPAENAGKFEADEKRDTPLLALTTMTTSPTTTTTTTSPSLSALELVSLDTGHSLDVVNSLEVRTCRRAEGSTEDIVLDLLRQFRSSPVRVIAFLLMCVLMVLDCYSHHNSSRSLWASRNVLPTCSSNNCVQFFVRRVEYWKLERSHENEVCENPNTNMFEFFQRLEQQDEIQEKDQDDHDQDQDQNQQEDQSANKSIFSTAWEKTKETANNVMEATKKEINMLKDPNNLKPAGVGRMEEAAKTNYIAAENPNK